MILNWFRKYNFGYATWLYAAKTDFFRLFSIFDNESYLSWRTTEDQNDGYRLLVRYLKTTWTAVPPSRVFASWYLHSIFNVFILCCEYSCQPCASLLMKSVINVSSLSYKKSAIVLCQDFQCMFGRFSLYGKLFMFGILCTWKEDCYP